MAITLSVHYPLTTVAHPHQVHTYTLGILLYMYVIMEIVYNFTITSFLATHSAFQLWSCLFAVITDTNLKIITFVAIASAALADK